MVLEPGLARLGRPRLARPGGHDDVMTAGREPLGEPAKLDGGAGEIVALRIELQETERFACDHDARRYVAKNARTASATWAISASVCPGDIGSERISPTSCSVFGTGGAPRCASAGC